MAATINRANDDKEKNTSYSFSRSLITLTKWLMLIFPFAGRAEMAFVPTKRKSNTKSTTRGSTQQQPGSLPADRGEFCILVFSY